MVDQIGGTRASCPKFGGNPIQKLMRRLEIQIRNHFTTTLFLVPWFGAAPNFFTVEIVKWINIVTPKFSNWILKLVTLIAWVTTCLIIPHDPMHSTLRGKTRQKLTNVDLRNHRVNLLFRSPEKMED